jgi:uncharacterized protein (DUF1501 family)
MFLPSQRLVTRRQALGAGLLGTLGLALSPAWQRLLAADGPARRAKACILVWLNGGPSHLDTFDPKPDAPDDYRGPTTTIDSAAAGVRISGYFPELAKQAKDFALLRSITSKEADHDRANFFIHTGNLRSETVDYPSLGAVVARTWSDEKDELPNFVSINAGGGDGGFFGIEFSPHTISDFNNPIDNLNLPDGVDEDRLARRLKGLDALNKSFAGRSDAGRVADHERFHGKALRLRTSPALKAFDLKAEKQETIDAYGAGPDDAAFQKSCLLARRLVENGVKFVEVQLDGWDTHGDNFNGVANLAKVLDPTLSAMIRDLSDRGMLNETLVLCMGEFGRTPQINGQQGRDHWSEAFSVLLAGGGVKGGQAVGATDEKGEQVKERPVTIPDYFATLLSALGIDPAKQYRTPGGRPIKLADKGKVVTELFS